MVNVYTECDLGNNGPKTMLSGPRVRAQLVAKNAVLRAYAS